MNEEVEDEDALEQHRRARRASTPAEGPKNSGGREITDQDEEDWKEQEDGDEEEEYDDGLLFFPTGFTRPAPKTFYRGSDPEWDTFIQIARDHQRMDKLKGELVAEVRDITSKDLRVARITGKVDSTKGATWLEFKFPDGPPREYEQPGIELTEQLTLRKTTRLIDQMQHNRMQKVFMPTTAATSMYSDLKYKIRISWIRIRYRFRRYMEQRSSGKPSTVEGMIKRPPSPSATPSPPSQPPGAPSVVAPPAPTDVGKQAQPASPSTPSNPALEKLGLSLPHPSEIPKLNILHFRNLLRKNRKILPLEPPRGTFLVLGLVEVIGNRGRATLDVFGIYDPNTARYITINAKVKNMVPYKQHPKGGP